MPTSSRPSVVVQILRGCAYAVVLLGAVVLALWVFWAPSAREHARRASCASNLKQLSLAALTYAQDWDERFPLKPRPGGDWAAWQWGAFPMRLYGRRVYHLDAVATPDHSAHSGPLLDYAKNQCIAGCPSDPAWRQKDFPSRAHSSYQWNDSLCGKLLGDCNGKPLIWDREPWHRHGRNVAFVNTGLASMPQGQWPGGWLAEGDFQRVVEGRR